MEGQINILKDLQAVIQKALINLKKSPKDRLTIEYIETRLELLENDWSSFKDTKSQVYGRFKLEDIGQKLVDIYDSTEDTYITCKCLMKSTLNKLSIKQTVLQNSESSNSSSKSSSSLVKLPKITIPSFSGKYSEWTTFHDLFTSLIHSNKSLDNVQKLHYLKGHLTGEAEQLIRHTPITDANYSQCWAQLEKRYANKKYLANCILKRLFGQKRLHVESAASLKDLLDTTSDCINALKNLNIDVSTWDVIIIHIVTFKLDNETRKQWELSVSNDSSNELPTFEQFRVFVEGRFRALECIEPRKAVTHQINSQVHSPKAMLATKTSNMLCEYCSESHKLCFCKQFVKQSTEGRRNFVVKNKICFNCLGSNHTVYECKKKTSCRVCQKRHHSLLHPNGEPENRGQDATVKTAIDDTSASTSDNTIVACLSTGKVSKPRQVLLATALVNVESKTGEFQAVRALLDQGSQACFITEATAQFLSLKKIPVRGLVSGVGGNRSTMAKHMVRLTIKSRVDHDFKVHINAYVLRKITSYLPERSINTSSLDWIQTNGLCLADPKFNTPNKIDILLGADVYCFIIKEGIMKSPSGTLIAQNTTLGWVLSGIASSDDGRSKEYINHVRVHCTQVNEDNLLKKFWEIEENTSTKKILHPDEIKCEDFYIRTTERDDTGRYIVRLPFRDEDPACKAGDSRLIAETRLRSLEKRLTKDTGLKKQYKEVIKEYLQLGHMRPVKEEDNKRNEAVYLPHHAVLRNDKTTTKVRVVFNASQKNKNGVSLNDTLLVGPTLQADLRHTVLKWRVHSIGIVADIVKMYRQVRVADEDAIFQRILWRDSPEETVRDYELVTVTFGTASAPYLAVRSLHQVAYDEGGKYPLAANRVLNSFYMDDLMTGCSSVEEAVEICNQMIALLSKGGFTLQKWNSNSQDLLSRISSMHGNEVTVNTGQTYIKNEDNKNQDRKDIEMKLDNTIKILGLTWNHHEDTFQYSVNLPPPTTAPVTKRSIISNIARLFDPLGWLAPSVVLAKMYIQKLWLAAVSWDEELSNALVTEWNTYREELPLLTQVRIPRWLGTSSMQELELHGFCDASKAAYSAVVYIRIIDTTGEIRLSLLVAKTRVAPIKQISIPRLELCGAVLLSKLLTETAEVLNIAKERITAWTDSTVVLSWLNSHPSRWKTFVANRTSEILSTMSSSQWFHVSTKENPADCASRGILPSLLVNNTMWFSGPAFLKDKLIEYKGSKDFNVDLEQTIQTHTAIIPEHLIFEKYSTLRRLVRVVAYCRRFLKKDPNNTKYLKDYEISAALDNCIKKTQRDLFSIEYAQLKEKGILELKASKLKSLCPFLDSKGIIRVRGRLEKSELNENAKHPIVLPHRSHLTHLLIADAHVKTMHGGPQLMSNFLRSAYWIIGARRLVQQYVRKCVICTRQKASVRNQLMGSLPSVRCTPARPFLHSGVDYAGPISIRTTKGRGHKSHKGYICLFVCMSTRAIHLEVVSDMGTQAFLAAFRRFVSRRGHCAKIWSDNGTNFVGASKELQQLSAIQPSVAEYLEANGTEWQFIPPHAPNFGGLWEAGIKATKFHLKRVIGDATLTYEEITTLLYQVEACLNSRPISVINFSDPGDPLPLTPGHFLIGEPLLNVPDKNYEGSNTNYLTRWQFVQRMLQSFWKRWSQEYLSNLMNRYKWSSQIPEPNIGDVVLIKADDLPPCRWLLGRVLEKHPGDDGLTRVVTLRTKSSTIKRPTSKLCVLPIAIDQ